MADLSFIEDSVAFPEKEEDEEEEEEGVEWGYEEGRLSGAVGGSRAPRVVRPAGRGVPAALHVRVSRAPAPPRVRGAQGPQGGRRRRAARDPPCAAHPRSAATRHLWVARGCRDDPARRARSCAKDTSRVRLFLKKVYTSGCIGGVWSQGG